ncbi:MULTISPECIES: ATP-binding protein [unclassified Halomonas]|uniref:ATP-binding protein n=1 Tax=unclassified Halomonas TaxID=2609666 RepID=UPI0006DAE697|nr:MULTISPECIES: ATP-binding protein [unclassified Halomonas]KPQ27200.1 MAG: two-component system, OmpR family, sensor kinase [Halomonas sp. HL-93]SBR52609.1 Signal transduction histidine kinase [Halomonas sp. HL-93]SNY97933.1 Signal transduction histidine kinase [Halomonas sp. hl-4]
MSSIRYRTLTLVLLVFGLSTLVIGMISYHYAAHQISELSDARLAQHARFLEGMIQSPELSDQRSEVLSNLENALKRSEPADSFNGHRYSSQLAFKLWEEDQLLLSSSDAPDIKPSQQTTGYSDLTIDQQAWRIYGLNNANTDQRIIVGERENTRGELIRSVALRTLLPELIGLPMVALLLWWCIGWGLAPLSRMAEQTRARGPHNLQPVSLTSLPQELTPIAGALNQLLERIRQIRIREERFIADAAHELRTPLAVLDLHAQNALSTDSREDREEALNHLRDGVTRATRVVSQLLALARLAPETELQRHYRPSNLLTEARETLAELSPLAAERQQQVTLHADESLDWHMQTEPGAVETVLQNIVGNAFQHTPNNGVIDIALSATTHHVTLCVDDQGPGIPEQAYSRVRERFQRAGPGAGAGLGLSIVDRVVKRHNGEFTMTNAPQGGLRVRITLQRFPSQSFS